MKPRRHVFAIAGITVITTLIISFYLTSNGALNKEAIPHSVKLNQLYTSVLQHGLSINVEIPHDAVVIDYLNNQVQLSEIVKQKKIIYRISEQHCFECIEMYVPFLNEIIAKRGSDKIVILGSFNKVQNLFLALNKYKIDTKLIYNIDASLLRDNAIERANAPYIFEMDSTFHTNYVFIPKKELPDLSKYYQDLLFDSL